MTDDLHADERQEILATIGIDIWCLRSVEITSGAQSLTKKSVVTQAVDMVDESQIIRTTNQSNQDDAQTVIEPKKNKSIASHSLSYPSITSGETTPIATQTELNQSIINCQKCVHQSEQFAQSLQPEQPPLIGVGDSTADLLVIAEHARDHQVFEKNAYRLYYAMLKSIQIDPDKIFTTNLIKCTTARKPPNKCGNICIEHLYHQITLMQPKVIFCLGTTAGQMLLGRHGSISKLRTEHHQFAQIPTIVSYHPEYLLRKPSQKAQVWQDLLSLKSHLVAIDT